MKTSLQTAQYIQDQVAQVGFAWAEVEGVFEKIEEELEETKQAFASGIQQDIAEELGDLLFSCVCLTRYADIDAEETLAQANNKFLRRWKYIERAVQARGEELDQKSLESLEILWQEAKRNLAA